MQLEAKVAAISGDTQRIGLSFAGVFLAEGTCSNDYGFTMTERPT